MTRLQKGSIGTLLTGALLGIVLVAVVFGGEAALSTEEFCTSCHSMSYPQAELKQSTHYGALGINPTCKDCHIPQGIENFHLAVMTHAVDGARELWLEMVNDYSTLEKFNERRGEMAHDARMNLKKWDSITCRTCHVKPAPPGESAQAEHKKMETEGATCIDCHQNLVHEEAPMTDLNASLAAGKLVLKPEEGDDGDDADDEDEEEVEVEIEETETTDDSDSASSSNHDDDSDDE
ncbi:Tetraheme cytochrome c subunit of nitrate or TMAO reductase [Nitrosomonas eutropha]|uniref:Tetraheme cytochrome c subunit of nitrate or TMAO reductase n=2 Tax=Nitrosomonas eutropha TaxID=916 RepID=A0A1I7GX49_9PROT|nr:NapC/NirT family cytochrome c [Nitrosomonas eutropha]SFU52856.1 Tetraheme cytochrome c subunit of nitrate or TMAO reductase [Nitrosomonas eutropha]